MELLDRYINAVGKHLPGKIRGDIGVEIRSTLEDMLEERSQVSGRPVDEAMLQEVLRSYGAPEKVAAAYTPERYLVGPRLYPFFALVLKIVFAVLGALALVGLGFAILADPANIEDIAQTIGRTLVQYLGGAITAFGNIVLVFAILERVLPASQLRDLKDEEEEWDPADLTKESDPDEIGLWEPILAIVFSFAAIVIFNFYPQVLRYTPSLNELGSGNVVWFPILSEAFFRYLPWLNLVWILEIGLNLVLLRRRRWTRATRWLAIGVKALTVGILIAMLLGPSLLNISAQALSAWPMELEAAETLAALLTQLLRVGLLVAVIATSVDVVKDLYRLLFKPGQVQPKGVR